MLVYVHSVCLLVWLCCVRNVSHHSAFLVVQYIAVSRAAFCYHYMPGLLYGELLLSILLDSLLTSAVTNDTYRNSVFVGVVTAAAWGIYYWSPWIYADPLLEAGVLVPCFVAQFWSPLIAFVCRA